MATEAPRLCRHPSALARPRSAVRADLGQAPLVVAVPADRRVLRAIALARLNEAAWLSRHRRLHALPSQLRLLAILAIVPHHNRSRNGRRCEAYDPQCWRLGPLRLRDDVRTELAVDGQAGYVQPPLAHDRDWSVQAFANKLAA